MRRTLAGLLFGVAYVCASLAIGGWLLQRTAFNPDRTSSTAKAVLDDPQIRAQIVDLIANSAAPSVPGATPEQLRTVINGYLSSPQTASAMANEMSKILHDAHAHLIGEQKAPVVITGAEMRNIVRNDAVANLADVPLDVPEVSVLNITRHVLKWLVPIAAIAALVLGLLGLTTHPDRPALLRSLGFGMLLLAVLITLVGYVVPRFAVSAINKSPWARVPAKLADDALPLILALDFVFIGGGVALLLGSGLVRRRRRWSSPVSTYRYREERNWS
ncbi:MAG: hypothetical protein JWM12_2016 [Ilumatobacteraceae bacterium]|nr:hypothetical protein [Ilumatobacteraceae bacterium]